MDQNSWIVVGERQRRTMNSSHSWESQSLSISYFSRYYIGRCTIPHESTLVTSSRDPDIHTAKDHIGLTSDTIASVSQPKMLLLRALSLVLLAPWIRAASRLGDFAATVAAMGAVQNCDVQVGRSVGSLTHSQ